MARSFLFLNALYEANEEDNRERRRQAASIRNSTLLTRDEDVIRNYRLSSDLISQLELDISPLLKATRRRGRGLTNRIKILCTLSFLAHGSYQRNVGQHVNNFLSQASVSRAIHEVIDAMNNSDLLKKYIRFPQNLAERQLLKDRFYEKFHIPGVIGCIDGTYVTMIRPKENEERFFCRKGNHARNIQLITDADLNIIHVDASYGGATHDSFIFNNSVIKEHLQQLTQAGETVYLLGDSGYSQRAFLMTPIIGADETTPAVDLYNKLHATARNTVERTIGVLKGRFRCLLVHRVLHYDPDTVAKIVKACCMLHNICNRAGLPAPTLQQEDVMREQTFNIHQHVSNNVDDLALGRDCRNALINSLWLSTNRS